MDDHKHFTVSATAFMRNQSRQDLNGHWLAVHYQNAPTKTETGTSFGLRFPMMIMANYLENLESVAERVARILNDHWNDPKYNMPEPAAAQERANV